MSKLTIARGLWTATRHDLSDRLAHVKHVAAADLWFSGQKKKLATSVAACEPASTRTLARHVIAIPCLQAIILIYLPLEKSVTPSITFAKIPFTKDCCVSSLVEIGPVVLEKKNFKCCQCIISSPYYLPLEKSLILHLNIFEFPLPKDVLCQVCLKLAQYFWRRQQKWEKITTMTTTTRTRTIDDGHISTRIKSPPNEHLAQET